MGRVSAGLRGSTGAPGVPRFSRGVRTDIEKSVVSGTPSTIQRLKSTARALQTFIRWSQRLVWSAGLLNRKISPMSPSLPAALHMLREGTHLGEGCIGSPYVKFSSRCMYEAHILHPGSHGVMRPSSRLFDGKMQRYTSHGWISAARRWPAPGVYSLGRSGAHCPFLLSSARAAGRGRVS